VTSIRKIKRAANARPTTRARRRRDAFRQLLRAIAALDAVIGRPHPLPPPSADGIIKVRRWPRLT
jgi:hypothetical protein